MPTVEEDRNKWGDVKWEKERERERNSICLKTCGVHYMLQKSLFEVCNVNGFLRAFIVLWGLQKWHSHR